MATKHFGFLVVFFVCISVIPAFRPLVQDLFVVKGQNKSESSKELDIMREVMVSNLLTLIKYHQVSLSANLCYKYGINHVLFHANMDIIAANFNVKSTVR